MSMPQTDGPGRWVVQFTTTAAASADAHALARPGLVRFDVVIDVAALLFALILLAAGNTIIGVVVAIIALMSLVGSRFHPLQRALIAWRFRTILGQPTEVTIYGTGVRFENPIASSFVPWSSVTSVKSNARTVAFFRDRVLLGYVPASSFDSSATQTQVVAFALSRIAPPSL